MPTNVVRVVEEVVRDTLDDSRRYRVRLGEQSLTVEEYGIAYFSRKGYRGYYTENGFWAFLGFLLGIPYCISTGHRIGADSETQTGTCVREYITPQRLGESRYRELLDLLRRKGNSVRFIRQQWKRYNRVDFLFKTDNERRAYQWKKFRPWTFEITPRLSGEQLVRILDWMYRLQKLEGFPDLTLIRGPEVALAEVKGPTDTMRPAQERSIEFLTQGVGLTVYILDLREKDSIPSEA